jgi:hypothetical protein
MFARRKVFGGRTGARRRRTRWGERRCRQRGVTVRHLFVLAVGLMALAFPQMALADGHDGTDTDVGETGNTGVQCGGDPSPMALTSTLALAMAEDACASYTLGACKTVWAGRKRTSAAGAVVWRYRQEIYFCHRSNKITYLSRTRWGKTYYPCCWDYQGHIGNSTSWNAKWSYRAFTEGKFYWYGPPFPMSKTPSIWMTVYGDGSWTKRTES